MKTETTYMGLRLKSPLVASASPLSESLDNYRRLEDAGAGAIVNYSLFEEEVTHSEADIRHFLESAGEDFERFLEGRSAPSTRLVAPDEYLEHLRQAREAVDIPVIASVNCDSIGSWTQYTRLLEQAGADAIELNIYFISTNPQIDGRRIEDSYVEIVRSVKQGVDIPVAVKLSPFFSSIAHMASRLDEAGTDGLVLFNRFYHPDIDLETMQVTPNLKLSTPESMRLPMRWISILHGRVKAGLAATSGIHDHEAVVKMLLAGADVTMLCSALLKNGIEYLRDIQSGLESWMAKQGYESIQEFQGRMSHQQYEPAGAFERANYIRALRTYAGESRARTMS